MWAFCLHMFCGFADIICQGNLDIVFRWNLQVLLPKKLQASHELFSSAAFRQVLKQSSNRV